MVGLPRISTKLWDGQIHSKRQRFVHQAFLQPLNPETPRGARRQDKSKLVTSDIHKSPQTSGNQRQSLVTRSPWHIQKKAFMIRQVRKSHCSIHTLAKDLFGQHFGCHCQSTNRTNASCRIHEGRREQHARQRSSENMNAPKVLTFSFIGLQGIPNWSFNLFRP